MTDIEILLCLLLFVINRKSLQKICHAKSKYQHIILILATKIYLFKSYSVYCVCFFLKSFIIYLNLICNLIMLRKIIE